MSGSRPKYDDLSREAQTEHALELWGRLDPRLRGVCLRTLEAFVEANTRDVAPSEPSSGD